MRREEVTAVIDSLIGILSDHGYAPNADWLRARRSVLVDPHASDDAVESTLEGLHGAVLGMGGLMDPRVEGQSAEAARQKLDELAERRYELTR
jgi:hypothetical protein